MATKSNSLFLKRQALALVSSLCSPSEGYRVLFSTSNHTALRHVNGSRIDIDVKPHAVTLRKNGLLKKIITDETALL